MTKGARTCNGEKTVSSVNGSGKTEQLLVKEWDYSISSHYIQIQSVLKT